MGYEPPSGNGVFHCVRIGSPAPYVPGGEALEASLAPPRYLKLSSRVLEPPMTTPPERMKPCCSTIGRTYRAHGRPRGQKIAACPSTSAATVCPPGIVPEGLPPGTTTGGTYSIGKAVPDARLLMSSSNGTTCSY